MFTERTVIFECIDVVFYHRNGGWHCSAESGDDGDVQAWGLKVVCESVVDQQRGKDDEGVPCRTLKQNPSSNKIVVLPEHV